MYVVVVRYGSAANERMDLYGPYGRDEVFEVARSLVDLGQSVQIKLIHKKGE